MSNFKWKAKLDGEGYVRLLSNCKHLTATKHKGIFTWAAEDGFEWLMIETNSGFLWVHAGYAWDMCSPKVFYGEELEDGSHKSFGTWDGYKGREAAANPSLVHDVLYQFQDNDSTEGVECVWTRKQADLIFLELLRQHKHHFNLFGLKIPLSLPYYMVVRLFGGLYAAAVGPFVKRK